MLQKLRGNSEGFTLIELMIVIAIIGILAAIAIPNFIAYRDKAYCSAAESDANSIAAGLADYFSIPSNVSWTTQTDVATVAFAGGTNIALSGNNTATVSSAGTNPVTITISVTDRSSRCPTAYQGAVEGWSNATPGVFTKTM